MKRILITGGPVHAHLDAVKILTNKFRGGLMVQLAEEMGDNAKSTWGSREVTYLTAKHAKQPDLITPRRGPNREITVIHHDGYEHYKSEVLDIAPHMNAVILGAAVVNLIPCNPWKGKFPSHNYKEGDRIPIDFTIAPRVINMVRQVAPKVKLFGFKLLSGVSFDELISAAYTVVLESGATAVFANDATDLETIHAVTRERGIHTFKRDKLAEWIYPFLDDEYYQTVLDGRNRAYFDYLSVKEFQTIIAAHQDKFVKVQEGYVFGTVAMRLGEKAFITTGRGKKELDSVVTVVDVDHINRRVYTFDGATKATLNAPLLSQIFLKQPKCHHIVHGHQQVPSIPSYSYAPPGTVRDSVRNDNMATSFNVIGHGCYLLFDEEGKQL